MYDYNFRQLLYRKILYGLSHHVQKYYEAKPKPTKNPQKRGEKRGECSTLKLLFFFVFLIKKSYSIPTKLFSLVGDGGYSVNVCFNLISTRN